MNTRQMILQWHGTAIELCMGRITAAQMNTIRDGSEGPEKDMPSAWYDNTVLFQSIWQVDNWWSVNDVDHVMGLVFDSPAAIQRNLSRIRITVNGSATAVDPEAVGLRFYSPEAPVLPKGDDRIVCHGARREAVLTLQADCRTPFDPCLLTLSFMRYGGYGNILIDVDYDGYDDVHMSFGHTTYLEPRFLGKDEINAITG